ncbi:MAG: hypothetical protein MHPSP_000277 [Paramarteilia canceri]
MSNDSRNLNTIQENFNDTTNLENNLLEMSISKNPQPVQNNFQKVQSSSKIEPPYNYDQNNQHQYSPNFPYYRYQNQYVTTAYHNEYPHSHSSYSSNKNNMNTNDYYATNLQNYQKNSINGAYPNQYQSTTKQLNNYDQYPKTNNADFYNMNNHKNVTQHNNLPYTTSFNGSYYHNRSNYVSNTPQYQQNSPNYYSYTQSSNKNLSDQQKFSQYMYMCQQYYNQYNSGNNKYQHSDMERSFNNKQLSDISTSTQDEKFNTSRKLISRASGENISETSNKETKIYQKKSHQRESKRRLSSSNSVNSSRSTSDKKNRGNNYDESMHNYKIKTKTNDVSFLQSMSQGSRYSDTKQKNISFGPKPYASSREHPITYNNKLQESLQYIIREGIQSANSQNMVNHLTEDQMHTAVYFMNQCRNGISTFGPNGGHNLVSKFEPNTMKNISAKKYVVSNDPELRIDAYLNNIPGSFDGTPRSKNLQKGMIFCEEQIEKLTISEWEPKTDNNSIIMMWQLLRTRLSNPNSFKSSEDLSNALCHFYDNFWTDSNETSKKNLIIPNNIDASIIKSILKGNFEQSLKLAMQYGLREYALILSCSLDMQQSHKDPNKAASHLNHMVQIIQQVLTPEAENCQYFFPLVFYLLTGIKFVDNGLNDEKFISDYWPLILALSLVCRSDLSSSTCKYTIKHLISVLEKLKMNVSAMVCQICLVTSFESECELNYPNVIDSLLRFDFKTNSVHSKFITAQQYCEILNHTLILSYSGIDELFNRMYYFSLSRMKMMLLLRKYGHTEKCYNYFLSIINSIEHKKIMLSKDSYYTSYFWKILDLGLCLVDHKYIAGILSAGQKATIYEKCRSFSTPSISVSNPNAKRVTFDENLVHTVFKNDEKTNDDSSQKNESPQTNNKIETNKTQVESSQEKQVLKEEEPITPSFDYFADDPSQNVNETNDYLENEENVGPPPSFSTDSQFPSPSYSQKQAMKNKNMSENNLSEQNSNNNSIFQTMTNYAKSKLAPKSSQNITDAELKESTNTGNNQGIDEQSDSDGPPPDMNEIDSKLLNEAPDFDNINSNYPNCSEFFL